MVDVTRLLYSCLASSVFFLTFLNIIPVFSDRFIPFVVRLNLAFAMAACCSLLSYGRSDDLLKVFEADGKFYLFFIYEIFLAALVSLALRLVMDVSSTVGVLAGQSMGLSMNQAVDPGNPDHNASLSLLKSLLFVTIFVGTGGLVTLIATSMEIQKITLDIMNGSASLKIDKTIFDYFLALVGSTFRMALVLAAPFILSGFISNIVLGLISRAVPQINILVTSLSMNSFVGLLLFVVLINIYISIYADQVDQISTLISDVLRSVIGRV